MYTAKDQDQELGKDCLTEKVLAVSLPETDRPICSSDLPVWPRSHKILDPPLFLFGIIYTDNTTQSCLTGLQVARLVYERLRHTYSSIAVQQYTRMGGSCIGQGQSSEFRSVKVFTVQTVRPNCRPPLIQGPHIRKSNFFFACGHFPTSLYIEVNIE